MFWEYAVLDFIHLVKVWFLIFGIQYLGLCVRLIWLPHEYVLTIILNSFIIPV